MSVHTTNTGGSPGALSETMVSALFDGRADADRAIERLRAGGVPEASIQLTAGSEQVGGAQAQSEDRGFFDSLGDFFFPAEDRTAYAEGLARGGYLVTVSGLVGEGYDAALDILDDEGAVNIDEREAAWRAEGWDRNQGLGWSGEPSRATSTADLTPAEGFAEAQATYPDDGSSLAAGLSETAVSPIAARPLDAVGERTFDEGETIPVVEERVRVGKRDTTHGRIRVRSFVRETPFSEQVELTRERVEIERRPVDRAVSEGEDAFRERSIEAEEYAEEAVVSKEARVVEEIALRRASETHVETVTDVERRTEVEIDDERDSRDRSTV